MKGLLKNREYLILMMAQGISSIGDWLSMVAIITLVGLKWNASPMEVSFIILCLALPMALLGPVAGTLADRVNRKSLMMISDLVRAGLILVLTIANTIGVVYICLFTIGVFSAVFVPAKNGKLKELVAEEDLKAAMSVTSMIDSSTKIIGPLLSGIFVTAFGAQTVFYLDSLTFLASALLIMALPKTLSGSKDSTQLSPANNYSFKKDFILGISYMKSNKYLLVGLFFLGVSLLILQLSDSQIIVLLRELTHSSPDLFGYIVAASGIGMFLSGMFLTKKTNYPSYPLMLLGVCGIGFSFGIMAVFTNFDYHGSIIWAPLLGLLAGFSASFVFIPFQATLQLDTPVHMTGRVFGVVNSVTTTATIIGPLLGGWLATEFGIIPTFILTASLLLVLSVIGFFVKSKVERGKVDVSKGQPGTLETTKG
ncbi:MFS transporter [Mesobacillus maritimus]|uniref:MFS transporter n=1 Tax=Mesobacillus maritimus TaxID=1643336 RepID=UPI00203C862F|nr:MFS transporter [Mesobacillus maritimus]MCM3588533.1 MFS transporter [Mesobacillus maritimus]MCM3671497.1 MFS transporter [Mesobacillus maritimus]